MPSTLFASIRSDPPRNLAGHREHEAHRLVAAVRARLEHQRAPAVDHGDAVLAPEARRRLGHAAHAERAVHPHVLDPEFVTLLHRSVGVGRARPDHDRVDAAGDGLEVVVTGVTLDLVRVGVDREHLVATVAQALVDDVASVGPGIPRDARHRDAPVACLLYTSDAADDLLCVDL